jgi:hypothetical protein
MFRRISQSWIAYASAESRLANLSVVPIIMVSGLEAAFVGAAVAGAAVAGAAVAGAVVGAIVAGATVAGAAVGVAAAPQADKIMLAMTIMAAIRYIFWRFILAPLGLTLWLKI